MLIIQSPLGPTCESHGLFPSVFSIPPEAWDKIGQALKQAPNTVEEISFGDGCHECDLQVDWMDMYKQCKVLRHDASQVEMDLVDLIERNQDLYFFELLEQFVESLQPAE